LKPPAVFVGDAYARVTIQKIDNVFGVRRSITRYDEARH
jgi:hypothetical protein